MKTLGLPSAGSRRLEGLDLDEPAPSKKSQETYCKLAYRLGVNDLRLQMGVYETHLNS